MRHVSIPLTATCEFLEAAPVSPSISKVQIKVCYVGDEPNRNGSIITKAAATEMAKSLPGCPIVGLFNADKGDFEEHSRKLTITNDSCTFEDLTKPYGFIGTDAKVWFQKFLDDGVEHEYLCTEGYIWTEAYPESKRIVEQGNGQSMELGKNIKGSWSADDNGYPEFFIINEALIEKLCILGEDVEPCFEGASITTSFSLSLDDNFKEQLFSMKKELNEILSEEGGETEMEENEIFEGETEKENTPISEEHIEEPSATYSLNEIPEYQELSEKYAQLQSNYDALCQEVEGLRAFKVSTERTAKEDMIKSFYMLSDAEKQDCFDNIDKYSLDDIEAKLSVICVRNKVNFHLEEEEHKEEPMVYSLGDNDDGDSAPAWIKAVRNTAKEMN